MNIKNIQDAVLFENFDNPKIILWLKKNNILWWINYNNGEKWKNPLTYKSNRVLLTLKDNYITNIEFQINKKEPWNTTIYR